MCKESKQFEAPKPAPVCVCRSGIQLVLNSKVQSVGKHSVQVDTNGSITTIPFGACVWSTGVAMHPLIKQLQVDCLMTQQLL